MSAVIPVISQRELEEVFPHPPLREVAFEIRFAPRLRVAAELWRLQDQLVSQYPQSSTEAMLRPNGTTFEVNVFQNPISGRVIKISQQNFAIVFTKYSRFEDFKEEVSEKVSQFWQTFSIDTVTRVGLRYVNHILLNDTDRSALLKYVRPMLDFDRVPIRSIRHFVNEAEIECGEHLATVRAALIPDRASLYVLDIDCHRDDQRPSAEVLQLMDAFHDTAQRIFLDHVTDEYKMVMRGGTS